MSTSGREQEKTRQEREKLLRGQYSAALKSNLKQAATYSKRLATKYQAGASNFIHAAVSGEEDALELDVLSDDQYIEYARNLDKSRQEVKKRWSDAHTNFKNCGDELITSYRKLCKYRKLTKTQNGQKDITEKENQDLQVTLETGFRTILEDIKQAKEKYKEAQTELEYQDGAFRLFQQDQGRVIGSVEKHKVFHIRQQRASMRTDAHLAIMRALSGSPVMMHLGEEQRQQNMQEVLSLLRQLEDVEGETDELVQRLELKVSAIQMTEAQQSMEIEETLRNQEEINDKLDSLNQTILQNNEKLRSEQQAFREKISSRISSVFAPRIPNGMFAGFLLLLVGLLAVAAWYTLKTGFWIN